jgi:hypothetical protein
MGLLDETSFVERLQFFNGQQLLAADLQGIDEFNREMRWLHNQSLHQPGIGKGFAVYGRKGDREVTVGAGYGIDAPGRELVLTQTVTLPVPPVSAEADGQPVLYDLAVSYPDDAALQEAETREGVCAPRGVVRLREAPVFCWVRLERTQQGPVVKDPQLRQDIQTALRLVLAQVEILNCQLNSDISVAQRRNARPAKEQHIACGHAQPVNWAAWSVTAGGQTATIGLTATIDTRRAGFLTTPMYTARIEGPRPKLLTEAAPGPGAVNNSQMVFDAPVVIAGAQAGGFSVYVLLFDRLRGLVGNVDATQFTDWSIVWMGVEG